MEPFEVVEYKKHKIKIFIDEDPRNPREHGNLGYIWCFHGRYNLGDEHGHSSDEFSGWHLCIQSPTGSIQNSLLEKQLRTPE